ncbi:MAG: preprotein translocase subunit SecE [Dehalococcoidia bacterium]|nr:preprotein translocase subunit SecE [Dehalococcoidia bacterium]
MGREARRAQARAERRQQRQRQAAPRTSPGVSAPPTPQEAQRRGSLLKPRWAMEIISELRKVTWPSRQEVGNLTFVVIVVALLIGFVLGAADLAFGWLVEQTILR